MTGGRTPRAEARRAPLRVRQAHVEWTAERLSERDWQIIEAVNRLRAVTGEQIERLCFAFLSSARSRTVSRSRALQRLVSWRVLMPLARRVGGVGRGSSVTTYALDSAGQQLIRQRQQVRGQAAHVRRPVAPGVRTLTHTLAVSELYAALHELGRAHGFALAEYETEPGCWWPDGIGGHLKPDAYARLQLGTVVDHWWIEQDQATEALPTVRAKLLTYLGFLTRGQLGPRGVVPRVLLATVSAPRRDALLAVIAKLPAPASDLFTVCLADETAYVLYSALRE